MPGGVAHWGTVSDAHATKALLEYLIERVGPKRISLLEGSGDWAQTGSTYFPAKAYDPDGWTVTWDEFDRISYKGLIDSLNAAQSVTTLDIVDLNDNDPKLVPVPGGGL